MNVLFHPKRQDLDLFIFKVTVTAGQQVILPLVTGYTYDFWVDWGDGSAKKKVTAYNDADAVYTFPSGGNYTVRIAGKCQAFAVNNSTATGSIRTAIVEVVKWGTRADFRLLNFYGCVNLTALPSDLSGITAITGADSITTMASFLRGCTSFTQELNDRMFSNLTLCTSFESTFDTSGISGIVPVDLFRYNTLATTFKRTFFTTSISGECDTYYTDLFKYNTVAQIFEETFAVTSISGNVSNVMFTYCGANATNFKGTFRNTNLGSLGEVLPGDIFDTNVNAITFESTFQYTKYTCSIPGYIFRYNIKATTFTATFANTPFSGNIPVTLFYYNVDALYFTNTFNATSITGIPDQLFWTNTKATHFNGTFGSIYTLTDNGGLGYEALNNNLFRYNTKAVTFSSCFRFCENMASHVPEDLWWNCPDITDLSLCFDSCRSLLGTIPEKLLWYCPKLTNVTYLFSCGGSVSYSLTGDIPRDLFYYNPEITMFYYCFRYRAGLTKAPAGLFRNNKKAGYIGFSRVFDGCVYCKIERYVFSESDDVSAYQRFQGCAPSFNYGFTGAGKYTTGSYASELWDPTKFDIYTAQMNINVRPSTAWAAGDVITGQTSGASCVMVSALGASNSFYVKDITGTFTPGEVIGVTGDSSKLADQGTGYPTLSFSGRYLKINVAPATDWTCGDVITGQSSGASCIVLAKKAINEYWVRGAVGTFTDGEVIGVTGVAAKLADQDVGSPTYDYLVNAAHNYQYCFNDLSAGSYTNYAAIPAAWK